MAEGTMVLQDTPGRTHYSPRANSPEKFECPTSKDAGPQDGSSPAFDQVTCSGCVVALIGRTLELIHHSDRIPGDGPEEDGQKEPEK